MVEGLRDDIIYGVSPTSRAGQVMLVVESHTTLDVVVGDTLGLLREPESPEWEAACLCLDTQAFHFRFQAFDDKQFTGTCSRNEGERVCMVKLAERCGHYARTTWTKRRCGHDLWERCGGNVHLVTRIVLKAGNPVVTCNR